MTKEIKISLISDTHLLPSKMIAFNEEYKKALSSDRKLMTESEGLLDQAINLIEKNGSDIILISGDLTKDGEVMSHQVFRDKMKAYVDKKPGRRIFVIPGNHDINNPTKSYDFNGGGNGIAIKVESISPGGFMENYGDLVFDQAIDLYKDSSHFKAFLEKVNTKYQREEKYKYYAHGYTSYASRFDIDQASQGRNGVTVIGLDTIKYSIDKVMEEKDGLQNTEGAITVEQFMWLSDVCKAARERNDVILLMAHQAFIPHFYNQENTLSAYIIDDWDDKFEVDYPGVKDKIPVEALADMGINYMFTGHMHGQDIAKYTSDEGNRIYDIETGSIVTFPLPIRHMTLTNDIEDSGKSTLDIKTEQIKEFVYKDPEKGMVKIDDAIAHATSELITPELIRGLFVNYVLPNLKVGSKNIVSRLFKDRDQNYARYILNKLEKKIGSTRKQGLHKKTSMIDIYSYVKDIDNAHLYGDGKDIIIDLKFLGMDYGYALPESNLNLFLEDVMLQFDEKILNQEQFLIDTVYELSQEFLSFPIGSNENGPVTLSDFVNEAYLTYLAGDEEQSEDFKNILDNYKDKNMLKDAINMLSTSVSEKLDYLARQIVYSPSVSNYIYRYTKNNRFIAKFVDKKFYDTFGLALIDTLLSFNLTSKKVINKVMTTQRIDVILNPLNNLIMDMSSNLTNEDQVPYQKYAYKEDNNTTITERVAYAKDK